MKNNFKTNKTKLQFLSDKKREYLKYHKQRNLQESDM